MTAAMGRLLVPDWIREGETWRVEPETDVLWSTSVDGVCDRCWREYRSVESLAGIVHRSGRITGYCADHLREQQVWVEGGRVVSWRLSR